MCRFFWSRFFFVLISVHIELRRFDERLLKLSRQLRSSQHIYGRFFMCVYFQSVWLDFFLQYFIQLYWTHSLFMHPVNFRWKDKIFCSLWMGRLKFVRLNFVQLSEQSLSRWRTKFIFDGQTKFTHGKCILSILIIKKMNSITIHNRLVDAHWLEEIFWIFN